MSIIHQALKKAQSAQNTDALPAYSEKGKGHMDFYVPASSRKIVLIFFVFIVLLACWWGISKIGFFYGHKTYFEKQPEPESSARMIGVVDGAKNGDAATAVTASSRTVTSDKGRQEDLREKAEIARLKNLKGIELYKQGKTYLALNEFIAAISIVPEYAEAYNNLGLTYKQLGDMKSAEDNYKKALYYKSDYSKAMNNYGVLLEAKGDTGSAREYFKKAIHADSDYPDPYLNMAVSLENEGRLDEAMNYYEGFLSHRKDEEDQLYRDVGNRLIYLKANRFAEKNRQ